MPSLTVLQGALAAALGAAVMLVVFGPGVVPPSHTGWMLSGRIGPDPVQYWLGWAFFRGDDWHWPPGLNPAYGLELSSSIFYADSIPLLAFLFKALRGVVFVDQYWGLWILACGALMAFMAWRLIGLATADPVARFAGAFLFALQPMMINRLGGHLALGAQFLILMGLWLCLRPPEPWLVRAAKWVGLSLAASLIHSYLLPMVLAFWLADALSRFDARRFAPEGAAVIGAALGGLWLAGFFVLGAGHGGSGARYGDMQLDLLAPFDPGPWGAILPDLPDPGHMETGGSYPGLGVLLLWALGIWAGWGRIAPALRRHWPIVLVVLLMLAFAISHQPSLGGRAIELVRMPERLLGLADALRASERYVWPLAYAGAIAAIWALVARLGGRRAGFALLGLALVQVVDFGPGQARMRHFFPPTEARVPLRLAHPFWEEAARHYVRIRLVPAQNQGFPWEEVAVFAATHGLATDAVYLARSDEEAKAALRARTAEELRSGRHEAGTLYVFRDDASLALALSGMDGRRDFVAEFDGVWVLAPGWWARGVAGPAPSPAGPDERSPVTTCRAARCPWRPPCTSDAPAPGTCPTAPPQRSLWC
ncbi:MAG: hypothetical protein K2X11_06605 [Acetobacteraceae bacterium]|nr:hypothetical protein [Acetobacteraceae bacterium]